MDTLTKLFIEKKNIFFFFLTKILDSRNFTFALENGRKRPNECVLGKSFKNKQNIPWDIANNRYVVNFSKKGKERSKPKKTHIDRGQNGSANYCD